MIVEKKSILLPSTLFLYINNMPGTEMSWILSFDANAENKKKLQKRQTLQPFPVNCLDYSENKMCTQMETHTSTQLWRECGEYAIVSFKLNSHGCLKSLRSIPAANTR